MNAQTRQTVVTAGATIAAAIASALIAIYAAEIKEMATVRRVTGTGAILAGILLVVLGFRLVMAQSARIEFTKVPKDGAGPSSRGDIAGRVAGVVDPTALRIVLYAHTDVWYVQPLESDPYTTIAKDGKWSNWTHLGHRYGALLVRAGYRPGTRLQNLPSEGGDVLAKNEEAASH